MHNNRELSALNEIATVVSGTTDLEQTLDRVLVKAMEVVNMDAGLIALSGEDEELVIESAHGLSYEFLEGMRGSKLGDGFTGSIAQSVDGIFSADVQSDPRVHGKEAMGAEGLRTLAGLALMAKGELLGTFCIMSREHRQISPSDIHFLEAVGRYLSMSIENVRLLKEAYRTEALEQLDRLPSELLANVSHELRTPLTTIKGYTTLLMEYESRLTKKEQSQYLKIIDKSVDRQVELIDQLLDMSRLGTGMLELKKRRVSISTLLRDVVNEAQARATQHQIVLVMPMPRVNIDEKRIRQVISNLIDNAVKFSPEGTRIVVSAERREMEIVISVADEGIGIPAKDLSHVFDQLFRIDQKDKPKLVGAGLGLSICKRLVEEHNGRIWMESVEGEGSTCYFSLPLDTEGDDYDDR